MNLGQTIITLGAFVLMSSIILGMNTSFVENGKSIDEAQNGIMGLSLATSYIELAQGLAFDETTISDFITSTGDLTQPNQLGADPDSGETSPSGFDDFDDFNGYTETVRMGSDSSVPDSLLSGSIFKLNFSVYYVNPADVNTKVVTRTFVKRMDVKVWRTFPESKDTLNASHILGYWHFE